MLYVTHSTFTRQQWPGSVELRKGLDVNIASAMASEPSDRTKILNSIRLPRAGTVFLEQEARDAHESNLIDLWSSFPWLKSHGSRAKLHLEVAKSFAV